MQEYTFTIPDNLHARELLNFILQTNIFHVNSFKKIENNTARNIQQTKQLEEDLTEAFLDIEKMEKGEKEKTTLEQFLDEF